MTKGVLGAMPFVVLVVLGAAVAVRSRVGGIGDVHAGASLAVRRGL